MICGQGAGRNRRPARDGAAGRRRLPLGPGSVDPRTGAYGARGVLVEAAAGVQSRARAARAADRVPPRPRSMPRRARQRPPSDRRRPCAAGRRGRAARRRPSGGGHPPARRRRVCRMARGAAQGDAGRRDGHHRAGYRRVGHRQGSRGAVHPCGVSAQEPAVRRAELRRAARAAARVGAVWLRARRVHRARSRPSPARWSWRRAACCSSTRSPR